MILATNPKDRLNRNDHIPIPQNGKLRFREEKLSKLTHPERRCVRAEPVTSDVPELGKCAAHWLWGPAEAWDGGEARETSSSALLSKNKSQDSLGRKSE